MTVNTLPSHSVCRAFGSLSGLPPIGLERDLRFGRDMWAWARLQAAAQRNPVYYYSFQRRPPFPLDSVYAEWGASHFAELWYAFDYLGQEPWSWTSADRRVADQMSSYCVNFAKTGNPNGQGLPKWPAFTEAGNEVLYFGYPITVCGVANIDKLKVFDAVYTSVRGKPFAARQYRVHACQIQA